MKIKRAEYDAHITTRHFAGGYIETRDIDYADIVMKG